MLFSVGIVGLPNVGKSTLFKALTKKQVDISNYPFCTIEPNVGVVAVPDEKLDKLAEILKPPKKTPTIIEFVDIAGLVKNAHQGEGLGNQFLAHIRQVDVILEVVRAFESPNVAHIEGRINPVQDIETIKTELIMKDIQTTTKYKEEARSEVKSGDAKVKKLYELAQELDSWLNQGNFARDIKEPQIYEEIISRLQLLTAKPIIYVFNGSQTQPSEKLEQFIQLDIKQEEEILDLSTEEMKELGLPPSRLDRLIKLCYDVLDLVTFYTVAGGKEIRAWTIERNTPVKKAAGKVHTDFAQNFIKAEVTNCETLMDCGSWHKAREKGLIRTEGKEYLVQNGDVVEIKI